MLLLDLEPKDVLHIDDTRRKVQMLHARRGAVNLGPGGGEARSAIDCVEEVAYAGAPAGAHAASQPRLHTCAS